MSLLMPFFIVLLTFLVIFWVAWSSLTRTYQWPHFDAFIAEIEKLASLEQADIRESEIDELMRGLLNEKQLPFQKGGRVAFLYRDQPGEQLKSLQLVGDHNNWRVGETDHFKRLSNSDLWLLVQRFPQNARIDYKLIRNGHDWILDPSNPRRQAGGHGENSCLQMNQYHASAYTRTQTNVAQGRLRPRQVLEKPDLDISIVFNIYEPPGYHGQQLPIIYLTDGHEFLDENLGNLTNIVDNLIAAGKIPPVLLVAIDPVDPKSGENLRIRLLGETYPDYARAICDSLVPFIEKNHPPASQKDARIIMGTSLGGLFAAHMLTAHPNLFQSGIIYSPAFWYDAEKHQDRVIASFQQAPAHIRKLDLVCGTLKGDNLNDARRFKKLLQTGNVTCQYRELPMGHSWGLWRDSLPQSLTYMLAGSDPTVGG